MGKKIEPRTSIGLYNDKADGIMAQKRKAKEGHCLKVMVETFICN